MATIDWTVSGQLDCQRDFPDTLPPAAPPGTASRTASRPVPLADVDVRLSRRWVDNDGEVRWQQLAKGRTDDDGRFTLRGRASDEAAIFRLTARFRNDDLNVRPSVIASTTVTMTGPGGTGGSINAIPPDDGDAIMIVHEDPSPNAAPTRSVGTLRFSTASAMADLRHPDNIVRAIFWREALRLTRRLRRENPALAFGGRVHVIWPSFPIFGASYSTHLVDILTQRQVHVAKDVGDATKLFILFHEMMHIWVYDHSRGTTQWLSGVASFRFGWDGDTMGVQEWPYIAFHEGFCDFASREILSDFHGDPKGLPRRRAFIANAIVPGPPPRTVDAATAERSANTVISGLRCLTTPDLHRYLFGNQNEASTDANVIQRTGRIRPVDPPWPAMTIWEILAIFLPGPAGSGFETAWQVGMDKGVLPGPDNRTFGIRRFIARAAALAPTRVTQPVRRLIGDLIDPASTVEPQSLASR